MLKRIQSLAGTLHIGTSAILVLSAGMQALTFVLLARGLGPEGFGRLMVLQAASQLVVELVSLGSGEALIRRTSRDPGQYRAALGHALILIFASGSVLALALTAASASYDPRLGFGPIAVYMVGELIGNRLGILAEHIFIGRQWVRSANVVRLIMSVGKLVAVFLFRTSDLSHWIMIQGISTMLFGAICLAIPMVRIGPPRWAFHKEDLSFGAFFALTQLARAMQFSMDRIVLGLTAAPALVAVYSAATRGVQFALVPIQAILRNLFAKFFQVGTSGVGATRQFAISNLPPILIIGVGAALCLLVGADQFARLLGPGFADTATILRWLSPIALLQGIQYLLADSLSGADRQAWRTGLGVVGAAAYVGVIGLLASLYGTSGLIAGIYLYQFAMIAAYLVVIEVLMPAQEREQALNKTAVP